VALLGTERQTDTGLQVLLKDENLGPLIRQIYPTGQIPQDGNREAAFLSTAALVGVYYHAGIKADQSDETIVPCPANTQPTVTTLSQNHLQQIIRDRDNLALLPEWLDAVERQSLRLPHLLLPRLLDLALRKKPLRRPILAVAGERGEWLAAQHPQWQELLQDMPSKQDGELKTTDWELGNTQDRRVYLRQLRKIDNKQAMQLLQDTWKQESAKDRVALLNCLEIALNKQDEAFLETCLQDKSKEVRLTAASLLAQLPDSQFSQRTLKRLKQWLQFTPNGKSKLNRTKKGSLAVELPEQWDNEWQKDGIIETAPKGKGQKAWWLEQSLALVPPGHWCHLWQLNPGEIADIIRKHEWEQPLQQGLYSAVLRHNDSEFAQVWLKQEPMDTELWKILVPDQREQVVLELLSGTSNAKALVEKLNLLEHLKYPWSLSFSKAVVDAWAGAFSGLNQRYYYISTLLNITALYLHLDSLEYFHTQLRKPLENEGLYQEPLQETLDTLLFRNTMLQEIINPTSKTH